MEPVRIAAPEIEQKLSIAAEQTGAARRSPALLSHKPVRRKLFSAYYDTPEFCFRGHGVALRLRCDGRRWSRR